MRTPYVQWRALFCSVAILLAGAAGLSAQSRVTEGVQILYKFADAEGTVVRDQSRTGKPLDLHIENPKAVKRSPGSLTINGKTRIGAKEKPKSLVQSIKKTSQLTIEAWITPANADQKGPARIVTLSKNGTERNFTLGQDGTKYDVRFRLPGKNKNGTPSTSTGAGTVTPQLTHVIYTRGVSGDANIFLNGRRFASRTVRGELGSWDEDYHFSLGDEITGGRAWKGTYHLVAVFNRELSPNEVLQNFRAGPRSQTTTAQVKKHPNAELFETKVAAILSNHCLECHDASTREGKLDLSTREAALAGGRKGSLVIAGNAADSLLWQEVEHDDMPEDREPLSDEEKQVLKDWINGGAKWSLDVIDPSLYIHGGKSGEIWVQRLTIPEYIATVKAAVGVDISKEAHELLPPDLRADGFNNTAYNLGVDLKHVGAYAQLAEIIVGRMDVNEFARRFTNNRKTMEDKPIRQLIRDMGEWILRGRLDESEVFVFRGIVSSVATAGGDFEEAVSYLLEAMLQSPRFIYRIENQRGDGTRFPLNGFELASRMSYILWGAPPDEKLYEAAESGTLFDRSTAEQHVERMLKDPRALERAKRFAEEWLDLERLASLAPNRDKFPKWNSALAADMREESLAFFEEVAWNQQRPLSDLLNAQVTFLTPRLAEHYGIEPRNGKDIARYDLASHSGRGGLLTQGSVLTVGGDTASMVSRGLFVLHELLRGEVKDPPPCVDTTPVPTEAGLTQRAIALDRIADNSCGGCHAKFEPLAFGLEKFDGLGTYFEKDKHGNALRDDGEILFPGTAKPIPYKNSAELMNLLAESPRVQETLTWKVAQFALGRPLGPEDAPVLETIHQKADSSGGSYAATISAIVMSDLVQTARTEVAAN
ncbi:MAG: DUF1592 domain-containing protein [Verrucomicrobiota bacterium]